MGVETNEKDRRPKVTRDQTSRLDDEDESRARYARIAVIVLGVAVVAGAGYLVYRRVRRRSRTEQLHEKLADLMSRLPESVRVMPHEVSSRLRKPFPSVKVLVNGGDEAGNEGAFESMVRKIAPAVVGTASSAVLDRLARNRDGERSRTATPEHD